MSDEETEEHIRPLSPTTHLHEQLAVDGQNSRVWIAIVRTADGATLAELANAALSASTFLAITTASVAVHVADSDGAPRLDVFDVASGARTFAVELGPTLDAMMDADPPALDEYVPLQLHLGDDAVQVELEDGRLLRVELATGATSLQPPPVATSG